MARRKYPMGGVEIFAGIGTEREKEVNFELDGEGCYWMGEVGDGWFGRRER